MDFFFIQMKLSSITLHQDETVVETMSHSEDIFHYLRLLRPRLALAECQTGIREHLHK